MPESSSVATCNRSSRNSKSNPSHSSGHPENSKRCFSLAENLVGAPRFELGTSCAQGRRATRLRYAPTVTALFILKHFPTLLLIRVVIFGHGLNPYFETDGNGTLCR